VPNKLASATSPYLLQHADNPVDWHQWGPAAFDLAKEDDKPVLLSVGYAACHWCHVMAHESFEDADTAALMNRLFVNIKVDREERPDVDAVYMQAVQSMTGQGGWPMTVFLTPAGEPFYAGTYFPPQDRHGLPSFRRVLQSVADSYRTRRPAIDQTAAALRAYYAAALEPSVASGALGPEILDRAHQSIAARFDARRGGFEGAPKFPQAMTLDFLVRYWRRTGADQALDMATLSFIQMARGGIYDQVGGGFHRYTVDAEWLVPHFEKMLYDNALLGRLGVHLWQATGDAEIREATERTFDWVAREMTSPEGGFYASLDADSEGHEGKFYIWDDAELDRLLDAEAREYWGVRPGGNFEGHHILHVTSDPPENITHTRERLLAARSRRVRPARDDKVIAAWNGLMLRAVTDGARAFGRPEYHGTATAAGQFLVSCMLESGGRVLRTWTNGVRGGPGFLEDHAAVALGFLGLYELTFDRVWLHRATTIADAINKHFWDDHAKAFFDTADDAEALITRPRDVTDNATPAGTSLAVDLFLQIADLTDEQPLRERAEWVLTTMAEPMAQHGPAFGYLLNAADQTVNGSTQVALVGDPSASDFRALDTTVATTYIPALVLAGGQPGNACGIALLDGRPEILDRATAYVCHGYVCDRPVTEPAELVAVLADS
jgi:uncharacterized protein